MNLSDLLIASANGVAATAPAKAAQGDNPQKTVLLEEFAQMFSASIAEQGEPAPTATAQAAALPDGKGLPVPDGKDLPDAPTDVVASVNVLNLPATALSGSMANPAALTETPLRDNTLSAATVAVVDANPDKPGKSLSASHSTTLFVATPFPAKALANANEDAHPEQLNRPGLPATKASPRLDRSLPLPQLQNAPLANTTPAPQPVTNAARFDVPLDPAPRVAGNGHVLASNAATPILPELQARSSVLQSPRISPNPAASAGAVTTPDPVASPKAVTAPELAARPVTAAVPASITPPAAIAAPAPLAAESAEDTGEAQQQRTGPAPAHAPAPAPALAPAPAGASQQTTPVAVTMEPQRPSASQPTVTEPTPAPTQPRHDFGQVVERLAEARELARPGRAEMQVMHREFGAVSMQFDVTGGALKVALANAHAGFAPAVQAAMAERPVTAPVEAARADVPNQQQQGQQSAQSSAAPQMASNPSFTGHGDAQQRHQDAQRSATVQPQTREQADAREGEQSARARPRRDNALFA